MDRETSAVTPPRQVERRRVTIGLDFGTATTKCCFREHGDDRRFFLMAYEAADSGSGRLLMPTSVAWNAGQLWFGGRAEKVGGGDVIRSFKMCLLCQAMAESTLARTSVDCPSCSRVRPGRFLIENRWVAAEELASLYLANVVSQAVARAECVLGSPGRELRFEVHSAAPLDQLDTFGPVGEYFERALHYAWVLRQSARNPWPFREALAQLEEARREPMPSKEYRRTAVFPETHAAMTAYLLLPDRQPGLYGCVDVGAGTTDVTFFWLDASRNKSWYYAAHSERIGMDDVDRCLVRAGLVHAGGLGVRAARERLTPAEWADGRQLVEPVTREMYNHYRRVLGRAAKLDARPVWFSRDGLRVQYRLFLIGGGFLCPAIEERFQRPPACVVSRLVQTSWENPPLSLHIPGEIALVSFPDEGVRRLDSLREDVAGRLCLLAYGLSHRRVDIPKYERDHDGVKIERPVREAPSDKQGHWW